LLLQTIRNWPFRVRTSLVMAVSAAGILLLLFAPRVPIGPAYHDFADKRAMFAIPNALDVVSNIPFVLVGLWALLWLLRQRGRNAFVSSSEWLAYLVFFAGVTLTGFGSFWYHMAPSNARLPWDLLPMTCSFMSLISVTLMERVGTRTGSLLFLPLLLLGMGSVVYWSVTAHYGHDDYRFYLFVQFFAPVVLVTLIGLFPPRYTGIRYLVIAFGCYVLAKLFETWDYSIYRLGDAVSGHSLKHVTAAIACFWILRMLQVRRPTLPLSSSFPRSSSPDEKPLASVRILFKENL
jgi:hypothetical protein